VIVVMVDTPAPDQPFMLKPKESAMSEPRPEVVLIEMSCGG
jgi:hypothetical protein